MIVVNNAIMERISNSFKINKNKNISLIAFACKESNSSIQNDDYCDFSIYEEPLDRNLIKNVIFDFNFMNKQNIELNNAEKLDEILQKIPNHLSLIIMFINEKISENQIEIFRNFSNLNKRDMIKFLMIKTKDESSIGVYLSYLVI